MKQHIDKIIIIIIMNSSRNTMIGQTLRQWGLLRGILEGKVETKGRERPRLEYFPR